MPQPARTSIGKLPGFHKLIDSRGGTALISQGRHMPSQHATGSQQSRAEDWARLRWWRVFPGEDRQLRVMREWLRSLLPACMARDDVIAVASELGANAVRHTRSGRGGQFSIEVTWAGSMISIVAGDSGGPSQPRVIDDPEGENGRGLRLVRSLSLTVEVTGDERGRFVRTDVPWTADRRSKPQELAWARETAADLRML